MPLLALVAIFIVVPLAELYIILEVVGEAIGAPLTILLLVLDSILGSVLLRSQGRAVWRRFTGALAEGRIPHVEIVDGVLVIFGGAFLITPGFLTDVVGLLLLLPPTRAVARRMLIRALRRRAVTGFVDAAGRRSRVRGGPYDVEGTATDWPGDDERDRPALPPRGRTTGAGRRPLEP